MDYSRRVAEHGKSTCCMSYANHSMTALLFVCAWVLHGRNMAKHVQGMVMYEHSMAKHSKAPPSKDQILKCRGVRQQQEGGESVSQLCCCGCLNG